MKKLGKRILICGFLAMVLWSWQLVLDRDKLGDGLIRLHVVANSDSEADQAVKLQVRDAVLASIREDLQGVTDVEAAKAYLHQNLPKLQQAANAALKAAGFEEETVVTLCREAFDRRDYDTFSLPAGVYHSLRIVIGEGEGHNWWCVAFPQLCLPATASGFETQAVGAGFSEELTHTLTGEEPYEVRFFLLDALGKLENTLFSQE